MVSAKQQQGRAVGSPLPPSGPLSCVCLSPASYGTRAVPLRSGLSQDPGASELGSRVHELKRAPRLQLGCTGWKQRRLEGFGILLREAVGPMSID